MAALGACANGAADPARAARGAETAELRQAQATEPKEPPFGRQTPRHGPDELWTTLGGEPETLDPARCNESLGSEVIDNLFAGLLQYPQAGDQPVADLAERWEPAADGRTWRFWLRPSGWADGVPVTAHDFVAGIRRVVDPATASRSASLLDVLRNAEAVATGKLPPEALGVAAESAQVLRIELEHPVPYFLHLCALGVTRPVPRHLLARLARAGIPAEHWSRPEHLLGNGPFRLASWRFKRDFRLEKNAHYWDAAHVALQRVHVAIVDNGDAAVQLFRAAELDVHAAGLPPTYVQALAGRPEVHREVGSVTGFYWLNTTRAPLDDVRVRRALSLAIDREALASRVLRGGERPTATLVPNGMGGYRAPILPLFDPERARALLAEAGYGPEKATLRPLSLVYNTVESNRQAAEAIQAMWKRHLGVETVLENQEWRVYLGRLEARDFDVARMGWVADYPDAENFLHNVLARRGGNNLSGWHDAAFEALMDRAALTYDAATRLALLAQAEALALADQPLLPLYHGVNVALVKPYVRGFGHSPMRAHPYKHLAVDAAACSGVPP